MTRGRSLRMSMVQFAVVTTILLSAFPVAHAHGYRFTDSGEAIARDGGEWRYDLPQIPRNDTYWIRFKVSVQDERTVDVRLVDSVNDTMKQQGRIENVTIHWRPDLRYVASHIVVTPTEDDLPSHGILFTWELKVYSEPDKGGGGGGPSLWNEHGLLIMGVSALAVVILMLSIVLKAPGGGVGPETRREMGTLRHHDQKMR